MRHNYDGLFSTQNWHILIFTLGALYALYVIALAPSRFYKGSRVPLYGLCIAIFAWLYIGTRPIWAYVDTKSYTTIFNLVQSGRWAQLPGGAGISEWFWAFIENLCIELTDASGWLLVVATGYIGGMSFAAWRWMRNHFTIVIFFLLTSFSFWAYGTNGIRNGMATSLMMLALSFVTPECKKNYLKLLPAVILAIFACGTHNSLYLLAVVSIFSFLVPSSKAAFTVWTVCLLLSPFTSSSFISFFDLFIDDSRFSGYGYMDASEKMFSRTGWRWDFIIYSAMPVILGWYVIYKKKISDWTYSFIFSVYLYANSFWMLINSVAFSNRFAYLSWFLYPIVLCMPLVKFKLWKSQPALTGLILLASIAFTLFI